MTNRAHDLAAAFADAPSARTVALTALPPVPTHAVDTTTVPTSALELQADPGTGRPEVRRKRARPAGHVPADDTAADGTGTTVVYVTPVVREALRRRVQLGRGITFTDLVLDALEAEEPQLRDHWTANRRPGGRFQRTPPRRARREEPGVQIALRLTVSNLNALDTMVAELQAPSRTTLVEQALRFYLTDELHAG